MDEAARNQPMQYAFIAFQNSNPFLASPETLIDPNWYVDSGASNHVTANYNSMVQPTCLCRELYNDVYEPSSNPVFGAA